MSNLFRNPVQDFVDNLQDDRAVAKMSNILATIPEFCSDSLQDLRKDNTIEKKMANVMYASRLPLLNHLYSA